MANRWRGEVALTVDGEVRTMRLTLGALAALEDTLGEDSLVALCQRFEEGHVTTRDVIAVLMAGLRAGGWDGDAARLAEAEIAGGPMAAARAAGQLLVRAFALPGADGE